MSAILSPTLLALATLALAAPAQDPPKPESEPESEEPGLELVDATDDPREDGSRELTRRFRFRPRSEGALPRARGVIGLGPKEKRRFFELDRAWQPEEAKEGEHGG